MDKKELDFCIRNFKRTGDNSYYEKIYRYYFPKIYRFVLLNIYDRQTAQEITADVFYKVYIYMSKVKLNASSFKPWVYKIAKNLVIDLYRKETKIKQNKSLEQFLQDRVSDNLEYDRLLVADSFEQSSPGRLVNSEFTNKDLLKGLESLTDIQRQVIIYRFIEDLDYRSIGAIINKSELAVRAIKYRAILKLKETMD